MYSYNQVYNYYYNIIIKRQLNEKTIINQISNKRRNTPHIKELTHVRIELEPHSRLDANLDMRVSHFPQKEK